MKHHITFWSVIVRFVGSGPADAFLGAFIRSETQPSSSSSFPVHQQFRIEGVDRRPDVNAYTLAVSPLFTPPHGIDMFPSWLRWLRIGPTSTRQNTLHRRTTMVVRILGRSFECSRESRRRRILLFRFEFKKRKRKGKKSFNWRWFISIHLSAGGRRRIQSNRFSSTFVRGNECIECAPSSGPRRSSVSNERESYLITNVWGVLETMVDREVKYRSLRPESWWKQFYWVRMDGISNFAIRLRGVCLVVKYQSRKIVWSCIFVDALYVQRLEKNRQSVLSSSKLSVGFKNGTGIILETIMPYICHKRTLICNCNNHLTKLKGLTITFETWPSSWSDYLKGSL